MQQGEKSFEQNGWVVSCRNSHILPSNLIETWEKELDVPKIPGMVFGNNHLTIKPPPSSPSSSLSIKFNAYDALKSWRASPWYDKALTVSYASEWSRVREHPEDLAETKPYDWTFTPHYLGTIEKDGETVELVETKERINIELLKKPDPILFFDEITLFDDELDDNGSARLNIKVRVMPTCFYVLLRYWLRVDNTLFRVKETRVFHQFGKDSVLIEFTDREETIQSLKQRHALPQLGKQNDHNYIAQLIAVKNSQTYKIDLSK